MRVSRARRPPRFYDSNVLAAALRASRADANHGLAFKGGATLGWGPIHRQCCVGAIAASEHRLI